MVSRSIGGAVGAWKKRRQRCEDLNDAHGLLVIKRCATTEGGASTVDAECGDDRQCMCKEQQDCYKIAGTHFGFLFTNIDIQRFRKEILARRGQSD